MNYVLLDKPSLHKMVDQTVTPRLWAWKFLHHMNVKWLNWFIWSDNNLKLVLSTLIIGIIMILINMSIILNFISLSTYKRKKILTGTLSGYFFLIFSPSALRFSKECSSLYSHFIFAEDPDKLNSDVNGTFLSVNKMADHWYKQSNHCTKQNSSVNYHK